MNSLLPAVQTIAKTESAEAFITALGNENPFGHHRVTATGKQPVDVPSIHDTEFRLLSGLARRACNQNEAVAVVVWGESGSGKSNLLRRLDDWARTGRHAHPINFLELHASPERLHRAVLYAVVSELTNGFSSPWHETPLYRLLEGVVRTVLPAGKKITFPSLKELFNQLTPGIMAEVGGSRSARTAMSLLYVFLTSAQLEKIGKPGDAAATAAVRRLGGDALDEDEAKLIGLRAADATNPLDAADSAAMLAVLAQISRANGKPLIICFDQIHTLPREQAHSVLRLIHDLNDQLKNTLLVLSEVQSELLRLKELEIVRQATWDRLTANKIAMPRLTPTETRNILEARLEGFLRQFEGVPEVARHFKKDSLFPLGEHWFKARFGESIDMRPRMAIDKARGRWEEMQQSLFEASDKSAWLGHWPPATKSPDLTEKITPAKPAEELVDEEVGKAIEARLAIHRANPNSLPPHEANLRGLTATLLNAGGVGLAVETLPNGAAYELLVRIPRSEGGETTIGLVFVTEGNATSVAGVLRRMAENTKRPDRALLVTDERKKLTLGKSAEAKGRKYYDELKGVAGFEHLELPFAEYASLEALDAVARLASDLEISSSNSRSRPLTQDEVIASHRRQDRLKNHALLGRIVGAKASPPPLKPIVLTDEEISRFLSGQLAISMGDGTQELARKFLNELPPDRRYGLDITACRTRIDAVAKVMADTGSIGMRPLKEGYFLLPLRRPTASGTSS
ncbi:AAA family ATPase [Zavarzinella formosa]|uniref:AAA family ATPase n=1 Tax=Zavarzinella formosa TaxID=360055 RepID=UPI0002D26EFE|nr:AAA family ATPase [Zavarzinella formosa]